jgi:hypothetical protein
MMVVSLERKNPRYMLFGGIIFQALDFPSLPVLVNACRQDHARLQE